MGDILLPYLSNSTLWVGVLPPRIISRFFWLTSLSHIEHHSIRSKMVSSRANFGLSWTWRIRHDFPPPTRFLQNLFDWSVVHSRFFLPTQRTRLIGPPRYPEHCRQAYRKFSRGIWKRVSAQNMKFSRNILPSCELHFSKSQLLSLFLTYNQIGVSYDYDFFTNTRNKVKQASQIPVPWTFSYGLQQIF